MDIPQDLVREIKHLKPVPPVAMRVMEAMDTPMASMQDIADVIKYDPTVTGKLISTCNSVFFGQRDSVESVEDAAIILGLDRIVEIALLNTGAEALRLSYAGYGLRHDAMWKHAVSSAIIAKTIANKLAMNNPNMIFTASLLKDIGKIVLDKYVAEKLPTINTLLKDKRLNFREAEKEVLGVDHAELGGMIAEEWNFSHRMVKIIRHHHLHDMTNKKDPEIAVVYLADCMCTMMGFAAGADGLVYRFYQEASQELGLTDETLSKIISDFTADLEEIEKLFKIT